MTGLGRALRTEYRKLVTTRMWWLLLIVMAGYMAFLGAVMGFAFAQGQANGMGPASGGDGVPAMGSLDVAMTIYTLAPSFGYVFPVVVGALSVTGEFRHMTITPTFLLEPRRTLVLVAKLVSAVPVGLMFGLVGTLGTAGAGAAVLAITGEPTHLGDPEVVEALARSVLALVVWTVVGVGFGAALPNQVAAVVVILAFTQFVEPILRVVIGQVEALSGAAKWLPGAAGEAIAGSSFFSASGLSDLLGIVPGILVLLGYALVLALIGRFTAFRRDIT